MSLSQLAPELIDEILLNTNYDETISFCQINKQYNQICKDSLFWGRKADYLLQDQDLNDPEIKKILLMKPSLDKFLIIQAYLKVGNIKIFDFLYDLDIFKYNTYYEFDRDVGINILSSMPNDQTLNNFVTSLFPKNEQHAISLQLEDDSCKLSNHLNAKDSDRIDEEIFKYLNSYKNKIFIKANLCTIYNNILEHHRYSFVEYSKDNITYNILYQRLKHFKVTFIYFSFMGYDHERNVNFPILKMT